VEGKKFDDGKTMYSLLPPKALKEVADVLTYGAQKYSPENWKHVPDFDRRYTDALMRHIEAYRMGEECDSESGKRHLAHAICCLLFLMEGSKDYKIEKLRRDEIAEMRRQMMPRGMT